LTQVLLNLLDNAVKYGRSADGAVDVRVWVDAVAVRRWRVLPRRRWVRIAVRDAGPGLSRRDLRRVFRRFYRGAGAQALNVSGTGLGLAVCRHVVRAHGGWIGASSAPGQGSTFSVYLPARDQRTVGPDKRGRRMKQAGPVGALWATRMAAVTTTIGKHLTGL
jgi:two-component system phosphate regulon sensor histidine kinase PhoR